MPLLRRIVDPSPAAHAVGMPRRRALVVGLTLAATPLWALSLTLLLGSVCACAVARASLVGGGEASSGDDR
jgi:hypothetical protein